MSGYGGYDVDSIMWYHEEQRQNRVGGGAITSVPIETEGSIMTPPLCPDCRVTRLDFLPCDIHAFDPPRRPSDPA